MAQQGWHGIMALGTTRSGQAEALALTTPTSQPGCPMETFFRRQRRRTWNPMRLATPGNTRQRMDVRVRHTAGSLRYGGKVAWVWSARRHRPDGRRQSLAGKDRRATARQMVMGYRHRWAVELFHKRGKQHLGFAEVATQGCAAVISHVHWVDGAYILLHMSPPGLSPVSRVSATTSEHSHKVLRTKKNGTSFRS